ncbi:MAG: DUF1501 domain-containing protein [Lysobacterales bacterium]
MSRGKPFNRRDFLKIAGFTAVNGSTLGTLGLLQRAQAATLTQKGFSDYRALVCIALGGGADSYNMLVPASNSGNPAEDYATYTQTRQNMAVGYDAQSETWDPSSILPLNNTSMGMNPVLSGLQGLYNNNDLAVVSNVGSLIEPVTKTQIEAGNVALPPQLFSHSDQFIQWERAYADSQQNRGWFGRVADLLHESNTSQSPSMNVSVVGNNLLQVGNVVQPYSISNSGPIGLETGWDPEGEKLAVIESVMATSDNLFATEYSRVKERAQDNYDLIYSALYPDNGQGQAESQEEADLRVFGQTLVNSFPQDNWLWDQLKIVARMIDIRNVLQVERQTFVVELGGWDTHDNQNADLPELLLLLNDAMTAFNAALNHLNMSNNVTTFTQSEFSRTLNSNGDGTDHGWGTHQLVMGGAVQGGQIYGELPNLELDGPQDIDRGRIIPTLGVEQYAATLSNWFGVPSGELQTVFPNLGNFNQQTLSFLG